MKRGCECTKAAELYLLEEAQKGLQVNLAKKSGKAKFE
jgi:hypothetical protein